jgi:UPF0271 protein
MNRRLDLNADVGEGFPHDEALLEVITSANVACGFHAGDVDTMRRVCAWALERGVVVGAQPSYRDREGFGRRDVEISADDLLTDLCEQVEALQTAASEVGATVSYLKPHGALYNRAVYDDGHAGAVVAACVRYSLPLLGLPGSRVLALADQADVLGYREFFADRAYDARGRLVARSEPGAVVTDPQEVNRRVRTLVESGAVVTADGSNVTVEADSICVHGDSPGAIELANAVRESLDAAGIDVRSFA